MKKFITLSLFFTLAMTTSCSRGTLPRSESVTHSFVPHPLIKNGHLQTIIGNYYGDVDSPDSVRDLITLPDGDQIALEISTPDGWSNTNPTVLLVHGLGGSHNSSYIKRLAHKILETGSRAVCMNLRGSGSGQGLAKRGYHGGASEDLREVIQRLYDKHPLSPMSLVGFSLGGNITLKLLGEDSSINSFLEKAIAVCPAIHLEDSSLRFQKFSNILYQRSFLKGLIKIVEDQVEHFPEELLSTLKNCKSLYEFDEVFTAPFYGFKNAQDYYKKCSSKHLIDKITLKTHILFAKDDPLVNGNLLKREDVPDNIELVVTEHGGHMGFLGDPKYGDFRWMDQMILHWLELH